jgi:ABC-type sugar transport system ATPase subunit
MTDVAIRVENLSKQYRIGARQAAYRTLREALTDAVVAPFRRKRNPNFEIRNPNSETIWALKDVSFEVERGEVVGIPSLRQAQYKAQGPLPHHRADRGLCRDPRAGGLVAG